MKVRQFPDRWNSGKKEIARLIQAHSKEYRVPVKRMGEPRIEE